MVTIEVKKVEEQLNHRFLFSVHANANTNRMELTIGIQDRGSAVANEAAVLTSTRAFADDFAAAARLRLGAGTRQ